MRQSAASGSRVPIGAAGRVVHAAWRSRPRGAAPAVRASVEVPVWNGRRWLPGLIASLRAQTAAPLEVIAVDNGSGDGSREWLAEHAPEIRVLEQGMNTGFAAAANRGVREAGGEAVALINT